MSNENICGADAAFRYTWPGSDEALVCTTCAIKLKMVANAIGLHLQFIPGVAETDTCSQKVKYDQ